MKASTHNTFYPKRVPAMEELIKNFFNLMSEYWYNMLMPLCILFFFISITMPVLVIPNGALALLSAGGFLIGLGEWINHPYREMVNCWEGYKLTGHPRNNCLGGIITVIIGTVLLVIGVVIATIYGTFIP